MDKNILKDYENSTKYINLQTDVLPIIFRDDEIQKMVDIGINSVSLNEYQFGMLGEKVFEKVIETLEDVGLKIRYQLWKSWLPQYGYKRALEYDFKKHPAFESICVFDEPTTEEISVVKNILDDLNEADTGLYLSSNLYPCYVPESVLGSTYEEHIDKYFKEVIAKLKGNKCVSCDYYPFMLLSDGRIAMMDTWVYNHMLFAKYGKEYGADIEWCIQTCNYKEHRVVEKEDVLMQIYMCMAFGINTIEFFTYATPMLNPDFPAGCGGMIGETFQPTSMYYATQEAVKEIRKVEKIYRAFKWEGTKSFIGKNNTEGRRKDFELLSGELENFNKIDSVECTEDTIISEMYDSEHGRYGYVVINYNDPYERKTDTVKFTLKDADNCVVMIKGEPHEFGKEVEFTLERGAGALVVMGR